MRRNRSNRHDSTDRGPVTPESLLVVVGGISVGALVAMLLLRPESGLLSAVTAEPEQVGFGFCTGRIGDNCVIDGDTFILQGETVRLAPIDAPEMGNPRCERERQLAGRAEARLHALLNEGPVVLERTGFRDRDRYGRLLRDAVVDGRSVSEQLVTEGLAQPWQGRRAEWC
jgi:endonuclease YncB( thermonuclease family)